MEAAGQGGYVDVEGVRGGEQVVDVLKRHHFALDVVYLRYDVTALYVRAVGEAAADHVLDKTERVVFGDAKSDFLLLTVETDDDGAACVELHGKGEPHAPGRRRSR